MIKRIFHAIKFSSLIGPIDPGPLGTVSDPNLLVKRLATSAFAIASVATTAMIIVGGYLITTAQGDAQKLEKGIGTIRDAAIGLVVILLAGLIINFMVKTITGAGVLDLGVLLP